MKQKKNLVWVFAIFIVLALVSLFATKKFNFITEQIIPNRCAQEGEETYSLTADATPINCCEGLKEGPEWSIVNSDGSSSMSTKMVCRKGLKL